LQKVVKRDSPATGTISIRAMSKSLSVHRGARKRHDDAAY
jgi:hypothetical protein